MTIAVYRIDRETGARTTVRERVTVVGSPAAVFAVDTTFPPCQCPRCRPRAVGTIVPTGLPAPAEAGAPRSAWGAYLDHTCACDLCLAADSPNGQCDTARALYEQARAEARR